jgi:hypothetical protein
MFNVLQWNILCTQSQSTSLGGDRIPKHLVLSQPPQLHPNQLRSLHCLFTPRRKLQKPMCQAVKMAPMDSVSRFLKKMRIFYPNIPERVKATGENSRRW